MTRAIDMHLNPVSGTGGETLTTLTGRDVGAACERYAPRLAEERITRAVMVILSDGALDDLPPPSPLFAYALAVDFRRPDASERLERARAAGVAALKFHPYLQRITRADHDRAAALARDADRLGMFVMVCGSYGTRALERHDGVRLAARLADEVRCPIVLSHGGGRQVLDAMLVAADAPQLLLETSFSVPYYEGSSIDTDFAFAMRKLGASRWMYGSDAPFVALDLAPAQTRGFLDRHRFVAADIDQIMYGTAAALLQGR
jgi:predicted TIM-barrel fold metal-dependent hydrolase